MARSGPLGWLEWNGQVLINEAAAQTYGYTLTRPASWQVSDPADCVCDGLFRDPDTAALLSFTSPTVDAQPWVDAGAPWTGDFYGIVGMQVEGLEAPLERSVVPRGGAVGGATFGPQRLGPRRIRFSGWLIGATCQAVDYGFGWLSHALAQQSCQTCRTGTMRLRVTCPDDPTTAAGVGVGLVELREVALTGAVTEADESRGVGCCELRQVEWEMTAGDPWLHACDVACLPETTVFTVSPPPLDCVSDPTRQRFDTWFCDAPAPLACAFSAGGGFGVTAPVVTIETGTAPVCEVTVRTLDGATELSSMTLSGLPEASTVTIDASGETITVTDDATGDQCGGLDLLELEDGGLFEFPQYCPTGPGDGTCITVEVSFARWCCLNAATTVRIDAASRYLAAAAPCVPVACP